MDRNVSSGTKPLVFVDATTGAPANMDAVKLVSVWELCGRRRVSAEISWPATGTPVGTLSIELSNAVSPVLATVGRVFPVANFDVAPTQPTGGADFTVMAFDADLFWVRVAYTRTSGGTGATLLANLCLKE